MQEKYYRPVDVLEIDFKQVDIGLFAVRTQVGWCMEALFKAETMIKNNETFIETVQVESGGATLRLRYEFSPQQIEQLNEFIV